MKEKICKNCGNSFPIRTYIGEKYVNLSNRQYCLECSPFNKPTVKFTILNIQKEYSVKCKNCGEEIKVVEQENKFPLKENYYCSRKCANTRQHTDETKLKIKESVEQLKRSCKIKIIKCKECGKLKVLSDIYRNKNRIFCSRRCKNKNCASNAGLKSSKVQSRRSKNEIYFSELCQNHFNDVKTNERMFNGWDADVIIVDVKTAVLWNGIWHYKKVRDKHSVEQVQNRDRIKIKEIEKYGYKSYIVKDIGKHDKKFVEEQFDLFCKFLK